MKLNPSPLLRLEDRQLLSNTFTVTSAVNDGSMGSLNWAIEQVNGDTTDSASSPDVIDFDRSPNRHVAFGVGPHRCLGSNHARLMFQVMISEILERLPDFEINGNVEYFPDAGDVHAVESLPVRFTPGPHSSS